MAVAKAKRGQSGNARTRSSVRSHPRACSLIRPQILGKSWGSSGRTQVMSLKFMASPTGFEPVLPP
jgi:hypothetical protein